MFPVLKFLKTHPFFKIAVTNFLFFSIEMMFLEKLTLLLIFFYKFFSLSNFQTLNIDKNSLNRFL